MSKVTKAKVVVQAKFGAGDIRSIKFNANVRRVRVTCKGKAPLVVKQYLDSTEWECHPAKGSKDANLLVIGKTPEKAYQRAVRNFWAA